MRNIDITFTDSSVAYPDGKIVGRIGEHNATTLVIELPQDMLTDIDFHVIVFETGYGSVSTGFITSDTSQEAYLSEGKIYCPLWQELSVSPTLAFTVEAYSVTDDVPVMIAKSPIADGLEFEMSADGDGASSDTSPHGLINDILKLQTTEHTHSNKALLDAYTQTETNLADAVDKKHSHSNKALLDTYSQTEANLADAVDKKHSHSNKALLDTYTQTEANLTDAVDKKHSHSNKALLDTYTQTEVSLTDAVDKKHSHSNKAVLDKLGENSGSITFDGADIPLKSYVDNTFVEKEVGKALSENNYTNGEKSKLSSVEAGAEVNTVSSIKINGNTVTPINKEIDIPSAFLIVDDISSLPSANGSRAYGFVCNESLPLSIGTYGTLLFNPDISSVELPEFNSVFNVSLFASGDFENCDYIILSQTTDVVTNQPVLTVQVKRNGTIKTYFDRAFTGISGAMQKGWYSYIEGTGDVFDGLTTEPVYGFTFAILRINDTTYASLADLPPHANTMLRKISQIVNTSIAAMNTRGYYVQHGNTWIKTDDLGGLNPDSESIIRYMGELKTNRKYFFAPPADFAITFPPDSSLDLTKDNCIILYLYCFDDIDVTFPADTEFYGKIMPDTTAGDHTLIMDYNPKSGNWRVGGLSSEVI